MVTLAFLALVLVSGCGAPKAFAHTSAYKMGFKMGIEELLNGRPQNPVDPCNPADLEGINMTHCVQGYNDAISSY